MAVTITNKYGLPDSFVEAVKLDHHVTVGDISCTQLIDSPQIRYLKKNHDIEEDVMDRMWALFGSAVHHILERSQYKQIEQRTLVSAAGIIEILAQKHPEYTSLAEGMKNLTDSMKNDLTDKNILMETTFHADMDGYTFSGTIDKFIVPEKKLQDYKVMSVWNYIYPEARKTKEAQQNVYAWLLRNDGYEVESAELIAIFRDWSAKKRHASRDYPPQPFMVMPVKLYDNDLIEQSIRKRIALHQRADKGNVPDCTGKERWATIDQWAAMMPKGKRALKLFPNEALANNWKIDNQPRYKDPITIVKRPGENKRCDSYCPVSNICPQRKRMIEENSRL